MSKIFSAREGSAKTAEDRSRLCRADGCPNHWHLDTGDGRFCRFHYGQPAHMWTQITGEQLDAEALRGDEQHRALDETSVKLSFASQREIAARLALVCAALRVGGNNPRAWIARLQARQAAGERLTQPQRHCLAAATENRSEAVPGGSDDPQDSDEQLRREDAKREQFARVQQYAKEKGIAL